jgi:hypothetical protein
MVDIGTYENVLGTDSQRMVDCPKVVLADVEPRYRADTILDLLMYPAWSSPGFVMLDPRESEPMPSATMEAFDEVIHKETDSQEYIASLPNVLQTEGTAMIPSHLFTSCTPEHSQPVGLLCCGTID